MKNCKRRTIFSWIFSFILLIPMFSIAVRCLYVVINKNAYVTNEKAWIENNTKVNSYSDTIDGKTYYLSYPNQANDGVWTNVNFLVFFDTSTIDFTTTRLPQNNTYIGLAYSIYNSSGSAYYKGYYLDNGSVVETSLYYSLLPFDNFTFVKATYGNTSGSFNVNVNVYTYNIVYEHDYSSINNVFEYSISQFVDKHGNGLINFFGLLEQYFMQSTTANALYFTFANWCLNYVLLVSCVWLLFSVLMWFINYCNYMLNTSFRKGHGD